MNTKIFPMSFFCTKIGFGRFFAIFKFCLQVLLAELGKKSVFLEKFRINSGVLRVARGGCGAKAPPLAARPSTLQETGQIPYCSFYLLVCVLEPYCKASESDINSQRSLES